METVRIQITDQKAYKLLQDLEDLHILKVIEKEPVLTAPRSEKYKGVFTADDALSFEQHTKSARSEWDNS